MKSLWVSASGQVVEAGTSGATRTYVWRLETGGIGMMLRAASEQDVITAGQAMKDAQGRDIPMFDDDGKEVPGVSFNPFPSPVLKPGLRGPEGEILTDDVSDLRFHANIYMTKKLADRLAWVAPALAWAGGTAGEPNGVEGSATLHGVELIDPESVTTPMAGLQGG